MKTLKTKQKFDNDRADFDHECNEICRSLNPLIDQLLPYSKVVSRIQKCQQSMMLNLEKLMEKQHSAQPLGMPFDFITWADLHRVFQIANIEFVEGLAEYIRETGAKTILEVGAGKGIIAGHVSRILGREIIMTDDFSWWEDGELPANVLKRTNIEAIEEFKPDLVIACWIPLHENWTQDFRDHSCVKGYILIGEHGGCTGCEEDWKTDWEQERWEVSKYAVCKTDVFGMHHSSVTYFKRP